MIYKKIIKSTTPKQRETRGTVLSFFIYIGQYLVLQSFSAGIHSFAVLHPDVHLWDRFRDIMQLIMQFSTLMLILGVTHSIKQALQAELAD